MKRTRERIQRHVGRFSHFIKDHHSCVWQGEIYTGQNWGEIINKICTKEGIP